VKKEYGNSRNRLPRRCSPRKINYQKQISVRNDFLLDRLASKVTAASPARQAI